MFTIFIMLIGSPHMSLRALVKLEVAMLKNRGDIVPNPNEAYTAHGREDMDLRFVMTLLMWETTRVTISTARQPQISWNEGWRHQKICLKQSKLQAPSQLQYPYNLQSHDR